MQKEIVRDDRDRASRESLSPFSAEILLNRLTTPFIGSDPIREPRTRGTMSREDGTYKTVKATFWPWLSGKGP